MTLLEDLAGVLECAIRERDRVVRNASARRWKLDNPDAVRAAKADYRRAYSALILERDARYRELNADRIAAYNSAPSTRERARQREAEWREQHRDEIRARKMARYHSTPAHERRALHGISPVLRGTRLCNDSLCKAPHYCRGLCKNHYQNDYRARTGKR